MLVFYMHEYCNHIWSHSIYIIANSVYHLARALHCSCACRDEVEHISHRCTTTAVIFFPLFLSCWHFPSICLLILLLGFSSDTPPFFITANSPSLGRSLRHFRLAKISVRGDGNLRHLSIGFFFVFGPSFRIFQL